MVNAFACNHPICKIILVLVILYNIKLKIAQTNVWTVLKIKIIA